MIYIKKVVNIKVALDQLKETSDSFLQIGALVKITDQTTKTEEGFYLSLSDLAVIMPKEKNLAYLAENRSPKIKITSPNQYNIFKIKTYIAPSINPTLC